MNISHVKISNILGIQDLEFDAGQFNLIQARNGTGKTSVLEAIKSVFGRGHDATLLRKGADKGEVVLVLDDGQEIIRRVTADASTTVVRRDGKQIARPAEAIKALTDLLAVNPVDFLRAPKKDRVRVLLESMPLEADPARLEHITGAPIKAAGVHALQVIDQAAKGLFDERTGVNRAAKEKEATIEQLRAAIPDAPGGIDGDENELQARLQAADQSLAAETNRISDKLAALQQEHYSKLQALQDQVTAEKQAFNETQQKASAQRAKSVERHAGETGPLKEALAAIRANRDAAAKRQTSLAMIQKMDDDAQRLRDEAEKLTASLQALDAYRLELLADLPISGLEIRDGELYRDGVHFDRLNTAQQVQIAVELAKLRAGELACCCVDGLELLDGATFEAFRENSEACGLQLFVTRVSDGDFRVDAGGAA